MNGLMRFSEFIQGLEGNRFEKLDSDGKVIQVDFALKDPADINELIRMEQRIGKPLPRTYKEFLLNWNGARLFDYEGIDGFEILGTEDILDANRFIAEVFEDDWVDYLLVFAKYIGEGNFLAFNTSAVEYAVVDCFVDELPLNWKQIAGNFDDFLSRIIESQGRKYWL